MKWNGIYYLRRTDEWVAIEANDAKQWRRNASFLNDDACRLSWRAISHLAVNYNHICILLFVWGLPASNWWQDGWMGRKRSSILVMHEPLFQYCLVESASCSPRAFHDLAVNGGNIPDTKSSTYVTTFTRSLPSIRRISYITSFIISSGWVASTAIRLILRIETIHYLRHLSKPILFRILHVILILTFLNALSIFRKCNEHSTMLIRSWEAVCGLVFDCVIVFNWISRTKTLKPLSAK